MLVLDRAGWHTSPKLRVPRTSACFAAAYAPESNPVEQVWAYLRANFLSHRVWDGYEAIVEACCDAWNRLIEHAERSPPSHGAPGRGTDEALVEADRGQGDHRLGDLG